VFSKQTIFSIPTETSRNSICCNLFRKKWGADVLVFRTNSEATETNVDKLNQPKETEKNTTFPHQFVFETEKKKKS
jgi:hypothetical protein